MVKENKTLDEKTASLWLQNTGNNSDGNDVDKPAKGESLKDNKEQATNKKYNLLDNKESLTERFELKMTPLQMQKLEEIAEEYNKHKSEVMRRAFEYFVETLENRN